jgi:hypothetical protein
VNRLSVYGCSLCGRRWWSRTFYLLHRCVNTQEGRYWVQVRRNLLAPFLWHKPDKSEERDGD